MSNRQLEDAQERRFHEHVARELNVHVELLDDFPFEVSEHATSDGAPICLRLLWDLAPPPGVKASGPEGAQWSDINFMHEPD